MKSELTFPKNSFASRLKTMLRVDFRRLFRSKLFYILVATALLIPVLMTVMMTMMDGSVSVDPQTGVETVIRGPENAWQSIGALPTADGIAMGGMDVMSMCNINMMFMLVSVFICLFISDDFRSGYAKNLFTVRAKKGDYVVSKILAGFFCGAWMCMLAKICLMLVFVSIFVLIGVAAKQKAWLSICGSLGGGMLLFMTVPLITPLNSTALHMLLCLAGGVLFAVGLGIASKNVLRKTSLV